MGLLCNGHWIFGQPTATFAFSRLSKIGGLQHLGFFLFRLSGTFLGFFVQIALRFSSANNDSGERGQYKISPFLKGCDCLLPPKTRQDLEQGASQVGSLELGVSVSVHIKHG